MKRAFAGAGAVALMWAATAVGVAAGEGARAITLPGQVRAFVDGELDARSVSDPPPEADLREMRLSPAEAGGYTATLTFAAPDWKRLTTFGGQRATHQVFVSLQPPTGARLRVHMNSEGVATLDRAEGDRFVKVTDAVARPDGPSVVFEIAPSVGMTADWEVQGHALVRNADGAGVHAHTAQVRAGSLTGEDGRVLKMPAAGTKLNRQSVPLLWQARAPMPAGTRPTAVAIARRGGDLSVDVTMDAPPAPAKLDGAPATLQFIALVIGAPGPGSYTFIYDVLDREVLGVIDGGAGGPLDASSVVVEGNVVRFLVEDARGGSALGALGDAIAVGRIVPRAQSGGPADTPGSGSSTPAQPEAGPPPPAVGPETDISVAGIIMTPGGGVAVESPVVPAGTLLPPEPASEGGGSEGGGTEIPVPAVIAALLVLMGSVWAWRIARPRPDAPSHRMPDPSVMQPIDDEGDPRDEKPDCSDLLAEVERARRELARSEQELEAAEDAYHEVAGESFRSMIDIAKAAEAELGPGERPTPEQGRRAGENMNADDAAAEPLWRARGEAYWRRNSAQERLKDAEKRLKDCIDSGGRFPSVLDDIDEVPGPFV